MALSINWNWAVPKIQVSNASEQSMGNALSSIGESIGSLQRARYQKEQDRLARERQERLDEWAEDDRTRKLAEEQRINNVRREMSDTIDSDLRNTKNLEALKAQRNDITAKIQQIKAKWGLQ